MLPAPASGHKAEFIQSSCPKGIFTLQLLLSPGPDIATVVWTTVRHSDSCCGGRDLLGSGLTRWWHAAWPVATLSPPLSSKLSTDRPKTFPFRTGRLVFYYLAMLVVLLQDKRPSSPCLFCVSVVDAKKLENFRSLHLYCRKFWFPIEASNILGSRETTH